MMKTKTSKKIGMDPNIARCDGFFLHMQIIQQILEIRFRHVILIRFLMFNSAFGILPIAIVIPPFFSAFN